MPVRLDLFPAGYIRHAPECQPQHRSSLGGFFGSEEERDQPSQPQNVLIIDHRSDLGGFSDHEGHTAAAVPAGVRLAWGAEDDEISPAGNWEYDDGSPGKVVPPLAHEGFRSVTPLLASCARFRSLAC